MSVSIEENVELPETANEPLMTAPLDAVTEFNMASLPLTMSFFQLAKITPFQIMVGLVLVGIGSYPILSPKEIED